jgi:hypothetical protein
VIGNNRSIFLEDRGLAAPGKMRFRGPACKLWEMDNLRPSGLEVPASVDDVLVKSKSTVTSRSRRRRRRMVELRLLFVDCFSNQFPHSKGIAGRKPACGE